MRDPLNLNEIEYNGERYKIVELKDIPPYDIEDYDLFDEKQFNKYIQSIKKDVRGSYEYREMIKYLRENMEMNKCSFYENVNNIDTFKIKIEIHHHPFSIEDIIRIVVNKRSNFMESLEEELVAKEVMFLHYNMMVGLIPLAETVHELVHNQYLFVPNDKVLGFYSKFYEQYKDFIPQDVDDAYQRTVEFSSIYMEGKNLAVLDKNFIYIDLTGAYELPKIQDVIGMMNERLVEIRTNTVTTTEPVKFNNNPEKVQALRFEK